MRAKSHNVAVLVATLVGLAASGAGAATVRMDENTLINLRAPAGNVLVGNPSIADVTLITPQRIAILGRAYGVTNLIITDRMGRTIFSEEINVGQATRGRMSVYRGTLAVNFACAPHCERTPMPGEEKTVNYEPYAGAYKDYDERARGDASSAGAGANAP